MRRPRVGWSAPTRDPLFPSPHGGPRHRAKRRPRPVPARSLRRHRGVRGRVRRARGERPRRLGGSRRRGGHVVLDGRPDARLAQPGPREPGPGRSSASGARWPRSPRGAPRTWRRATRCRTMPPAATSAAEYTQRGIQWYSFGEIIGVSNADWGSAAADHIYSMWKASAPHARDHVQPRLQLHRHRLRRTGRATAPPGPRSCSPTRRTTRRPRPRSMASVVSGTDGHVPWTGHDVKLQTPTWPACASFDVQYRVDGGDVAHGPRTTRRATRSTLSGPRRAATGTASGSGPRTSAVTSRAWTSEGRVWVP